MEPWIAWEYALVTSMLLDIKQNSLALSQKIYIFSLMCLIKVHHLRDIEVKETIYLKPFFKKKKETIYLKTLEIL